MLYSYIFFYHRQVNIRWKPYTTRSHPSRYYLADINESECSITKTTSIVNDHDGKSPMVNGSCGVCWRWEYDTQSMRHMFQADESTIATTTNLIVSMESETETIHQRHHSLLYHTIDHACRYWFHKSLRTNAVNPYRDRGNIASSLNNNIHWTTQRSENGSIHSSSFTKISNPNWLRYHHICGSNHQTPMAWRVVVHSRSFFVTESSHP